MQLISNIKPSDVLSKYIEMYEPEELWDSESEFQHFVEIFGQWMVGIMNNSIHGHPDKLKLSLSKVSYLGKKTRALLAVMNVEEPKTLGELKQQFINLHSQYK
jgi:hypothetical protein